MSAQNDDDDRNLDFWKSRLQNSLLKLHDEIHTSVEQDHKNAILFEAWQDQWAQKKEQISQRLAMIEEHLERHFTTLQPKHDFSLVGVHDDGLQTDF